MAKRAAVLFVRSEAAEDIFSNWCSAKEGCGGGSDWVVRTVCPGYVGSQKNQTG